MHDCNILPDLVSWGCPGDRLVKEASCGRGWTRPWDGRLALCPCPDLTSTIIDLSGNEATHILTVSAIDVAF
jgi:hypothetical protein